MTDLVQKIADAVEKLAWEIPAPNQYTPRLIEIAQAARREAIRQSLADAGGVVADSAVMWGRSYEADFSAGTWTFAMEPGFAVGAGRYAIVRENDLSAVSAPAGAADQGGNVFQLECLLNIGGKQRRYWIDCDQSAYETEKRAGGPCRVLYTHPDSGRVAELEAENRIATVALAAKMRRIAALEAQLAERDGELAEAIESNSRYLHGMNGLQQQLTASREREGMMRDALAEIVRLIKSAGVSHLMTGVQLGHVSWAVKMNDALDAADAAIAADKEKK